MLSYINISFTADANCPINRSYIELLYSSASDSAMSRKRTRAPTVTVSTRLTEHPGVFRVDNGVLFCEYCDVSVEWKSKSTVDDHCISKKHIAQGKLYNAKQREKKQVTLDTNFRAADIRKKVIEDLIEAFATADIPLEKVNRLLPFFKEHLKEGGAIPKAATLRQIYLPRVYDKHLNFKNFPHIFLNIQLAPFFKLVEFLIQHIFIWVTSTEKILDDIRLLKN